jgi:hypothetical protein
MKNEVAAPTPNPFQAYSYYLSHDHNKMQWDLKREV